MTAPLPHLRLQRSASFAARKSRQSFPPYKPAERDHDKFYAAIKKSLDQLDRRHEKNAERYAKYKYVPSQTFRMDLTQSVGYSRFKSDLESVGIKTVSSALKNQWIVEGVGDYRTQLAAKAKERATKAEEQEAKAKETRKDKPTFVDAIKKITAISSDEKMDQKLFNSPSVAAVEDFDIETWPMSNDKLGEFGSMLYQLARDNGGDVLDMFYADDYCAIQIRCNASLLREIASMSEVVRITRPPQLRAGARPNLDIMDIAATDGPDPNAPGILVVDSGIVKHPLLTPAIAEFVPVSDADNTGIDAYDDEGHGTRVAGIAVYGDVQACVDKKEFRPEVRLYSAKVMKKGPNGGAVFGKLIDGQIEHAVDEIAARHPSCRIVNLSLGDNAPPIVPRGQQLRLAALIDRLSTSHKRLLFVVSAGNIEDDTGRPYPSYLIDRPPMTHLIDPATSAHAITVGSVFKRDVGLGHQDHPSPNTRVGPGLARMTKPDIVDYGGGYIGSNSSYILTMNMAWAQEGQLFTFDLGTSMSAPKVAHTLALMQKAMPDAPRNLLKALLISSAEIPLHRPSPLDTLSLYKGKELSTLLHIYGHGRPDLDRALHSQANRAVFVYDGNIHLNHVDLFAVRVPDMLVTTHGHSAIEVTQAFDPPTDGSRKPYFGVAMKYHMYKNTDLGTVRKCYADEGKPAGQNNFGPSLIKKKQSRPCPWH